MMPSRIPILVLLGLLAISALASSTPVQPVPWPEVFHARLNRSGLLAGGHQGMEIYYDWLGGRQVEIFQKDGKPPTYANHRANGSLYNYSPGVPGCKLIQFKVGLLRPDWMQNGTYKGQQEVNGRNCDVWALAQLLPGKHLPFLTYYDDASTGQMVREEFFIRVTDDVVHLNPGEMGSEDLFQIPEDCFKNSTEVLIATDLPEYMPGLHIWQGNR